MNYIEERIEELENELESQKCKLRSLANILSPGHTKECYFTKNKDKVSEIAFTIFKDGAPWPCYCKNKKTHNKRCIKYLTDTLLYRCDCGHKDIEGFLGEC